MNIENKEDKDTAQSVGSSAPVGIAGGGAGPDRPLANDCGTPSVGNQAGAFTRATGTKTVGRTISTPGRNVAVMDVVFIENDEHEHSKDTSTHNRIRQIVALKRSNSLGSGKKRKVADLSITEERETIKKTEAPEVFVIMEAIDMIQKCAQDLEKRIAENPNTKREIKEISTRLKKNVAALAMETNKKWLERHKWRPVETPKYETETQTDTHGSIGQFKEVATQTGPELEGPLRKFLLSAEEISLRVNAGVDRESIQFLADLGWESGAFKRSTVKRGDILEVTSNEDVAVFMNHKKVETSKLMRRLSDGIPQIKICAEKGIPNVNKVIYIVNRSSIAEEEMMATEEQERHIWLVGEDEEREEADILFDVYNTTKRLMKMWQERDRKRVVLVFQDMKNIDKKRKVIECALKDADIQVGIYFPNVREKADAEGAWKTEAVIVEAGERSYASLLKVVKKRVLVEGMQDKIKSVRKTRSGDLLLTMETNNGEALPIAKAIAASGENLKTRTVGGRTTKADKVTLHIKDMDAVTTSEEVEYAIKEQLKGEGKCNEIKIGPLRPSFGETKAVTVALERVGAEALLRKGRTRIGMVSCRVIERVEVNTCYRCWEIGHRAKECKGVDRSALCRKCGEENHQARSCEKPAYCPICKKAGHKALSMTCPKFRAGTEKPIQGPSSKGIAANASGGQWRRRGGGQPPARALEEKRRRRGGVGEIQTPHDAEDY